MLVNSGNMAWGEVLLTTQEQVLQDVTDEMKRQGVAPVPEDITAQRLGTAIRTAKRNNSSAKWVWSWLMIVGKRKNPPAAASPSAEDHPVTVDDPVTSSLPYDPIRDIEIKDKGNKRTGFDANNPD
ncbi:hypothetical protein GQ44DRAFT_351713 [Phaeosphaeriaceae sp. PMI808]|nr:hypothetical protein GQ44DRAFT_351713 [Phaeosphaeriaceae sp. PMI808]